jgi:hypothetical protein
MNRKFSLVEAAAASTVAAFDRATTEGMTNIGFSAVQAGAPLSVSRGHQAYNCCVPPAFDANGLAIFDREFTAIRNFIHGNIMFDADETDDLEAISQYLDDLVADARALRRKSGRGRPKRKPRRCR